MFSFYNTYDEDDSNIDNLYSIGFIVNDCVVNNAYIDKDTIYNGLAYNDIIDNTLNLLEDILSSSSSASNK